MSLTLTSWLLRGQARVGGGGAGGKGGAGGSKAAAAGKTGSGTGAGGGGVSIAAQRKARLASKTAYVCGEAAHESFQRMLAKFAETFDSQVCGCACLCLCRCLLCACAFFLFYILI